MTLNHHLSQQPTLKLYPLKNYLFGVKDAQVEQDQNTGIKMQRLLEEYESQGMRITVEGVLIVHDHSHPHVMLFKLAENFYKLPGNTLKPGQDEIQGLQSILTQQLDPILLKNETKDVNQDIQVGELLG
ncbi:hypothetical protein HDV02_003402 [Globomyces sp. JEL0801]|nr:hypothetical protein HDV02_003402 [Globomyces sp. JEL0801]